LKWKDLLIDWIVGDKFCVNDKVLDRFWHMFSEKLSHVWVGYCHVLKVSAVDSDYGLFFTPKMNLTSKPIILVLASKVNAFETLQNNLNAFGRLCKHRL
jgi:hypothetical protein